MPDDRKLQLDLGPVKAALEADGWETVTDAIVMVIVKREVEVSVFKSGKMLIKTRDPAAALAAFKAIHPHVEPDASHEPDVEGLDRIERRPDPAATTAEHRG